MYIPSFKNIGLTDYCSLTLKARNWYKNSRLRPNSKLNAYIKKKNPSNNLEGTSLDTFGRVYGLGQFKFPSLCIKSWTFYDKKNI